MARYQNLKELAEAFESGEIDRCEWEIEIGENHSFLRWVCNFPTEITALDREKLWYNKYFEGQNIYQSGPIRDTLVEALDALGIPTRRV